MKGLILAGGKSSRMGADKGQLDFHGIPQIEYLFNLLRNYCDEVFTSCKKDNLVATQFNPVFDQFDFASPLNGILSAMQFRPGFDFITIATDMPEINSGSIDWILKNRNKNHPATCFKDSDGNLPDPMFVIWENTALPLMQTFVKRKKISTREFLIEINACILTAPDQKILLNINTPEQYQTWRQKNKKG